MPSFRVETSQRLDKCLMNYLKLSRSKSLSILEHGLVKVNDQTVTLKAKGRILELGDRVEFSAIAVADLEVIKAVNLNLRLLHVEEGFVVIDKPAGLSVIPLSHVDTQTVLNDLVQRFPEIQGIGESGLRSGVVHRLDNDTSGVLVVARQEEAWHKLRKAFKTRQTRKIYHALVLGQLTGQGRLSEYLAVTQHSPAKVTVVNDNHKDARLCDLRWRSIEIFKGASLLEIELGTGFLHQIRVMMAHLGHPVLGDSIYAQRGVKVLTCPRQMLHASSLSFLDLTVTSDFPADFKSCLEKLSK